MCIKKSLQGLKLFCRNSETLLLFFIVFLKLPQGSVCSDPWDPAAWCLLYTPSQPTVPRVATWATTATYLQITAFKTLTQIVPEHRVTTSAAQIFFLSRTPPSGSSYTPKCVRTTLWESLFCFIIAIELSELCEGQLFMGSTSELLPLQNEKVAQCRVFFVFWIWRSEREREIKRDTERESWTFNSGLFLTPVEEIL